MTADEKEKVRLMRYEGASYSKIASNLGISLNTIKSFCQRNQLLISGIERKEKFDHCKQCGKKLLQKSKKKPKKFCSDKCRRAWWKAHNSDTSNRKAYYHLTCACCGKGFASYGNKNRKYCSHACYIKDRFEGGEAHDARAV